MKVEMNKKAFGVCVQQKHLSDKELVVDKKAKTSMTVMMMLIKKKKSVLIENIGDFAGNLYEEYAIDIGIGINIDINNGYSIDLDIDIGIAIGIGK